jgi:hypothetical protein
MAFIYSLVCKNTFSAATALLNPSVVVHTAAQINTHTHAYYHHRRKQSDVLHTNRRKTNAAEEFSFRSTLPFAD